MSRWGNSKAFHQSPPKVRTKCNDTSRDESIDDMLRQHDDPETAVAATAVAAASTTPSSPLTTFTFIRKQSKMRVESSKPLPRRREFEDLYETLDLLGAGSFGTVYTCRRRGRRGRLQRENATVKKDQVDDDNDEENGDDDEIQERNTNMDGAGIDSIATSGNNDDMNDVIYAVKVIDRSKLRHGVNKTSTNDNDNLFREVEIMRDLHQLHRVPNIINLIDFFANDDAFYMVLTYASGGDACMRLCRRTQYNECDARRFAKTLLETLRAMHAVRPYPIIHRDLKPENILLRDANDDSNILLADFGFARYVDRFHPFIDKDSDAVGGGGGGGGGGKTDDGGCSRTYYCTTLCGTLPYMAPEIIRRRPYNTAVDVWSAGCIIFMLLGGEAPFREEGGSSQSDRSHARRKLMYQIRAGDYSFPEHVFRHVSIEAKRFLMSLLRVNHRIRPTAEEALQCDWFQRVSDDEIVRNDLMASVRTLQRHQRERAIDPQKMWKKAFNAIEFATTAAFWDPDNITFAGNAAFAATTSSAAADRIYVDVKPLSFNDVYEIIELIEEGSCGFVYKALHKATGDTYAVKRIDRTCLPSEEDQNVMNEVSLLQSLIGNRYVVQLLDFYEEENAFYLILEYMAGGDVFDRMVELDCYTEEDARQLALALLLAVQSLHRSRIAHRDIKPQNIMLPCRERHAMGMKLIDFEFARRVHAPESVVGREGTPCFVAPEIVKNLPHDERVDLWSVGVVIYTILMGYGPFMKEDQDELFRDIRTGNWTFNDEKNHCDGEDGGQGSVISDDAKALILGLLAVDPNERMSIDDAIRCSWFQRRADALSENDLSASIRTLKRLRQSLRAVARTVLRMQILSPKA